ncbi:membrane protein [Lysinibacillus contaminans]|uniref:Membrane protein n=1 Tax=Lysinibacillus contaminans TaxID=1293441 RepID=A0ABR5JX24_9BACI|nr:hypothetical protein [Lysinibacillus contaminans]KOS66521.1 membrane protein [Lysinibacillus contaminans]
MNTFGIFIAIFTSAFIALGIADYYDQPHNWYLFLLMVLTGVFIHIIILILKADIDEEEGA